MSLFKTLENILVIYFPFFTHYHVIYEKYLKEIASSDDVIITL